MARRKRTGGRAGLVLCSLTGGMLRDKPLRYPTPQHKDCQSAVLPSSKHGGVARCMFAAGRVPTCTCATVGARACRLPGGQVSGNGGIYPGGGGPGGGGGGGGAGGGGGGMMLVAPDLGAVSSFAFNAFNSVLLLLPAWCLPRQSTAERETLPFKQDQEKTVPPFLQGSRHGWQTADPSFNSAPTDLTRIPHFALFVAGSKDMYMG